jgi:hypothetical protein
MTAEQKAEAIRRAAELSVDHISAWFATGTGSQICRSMREEIERNMAESLKFTEDCQSAFKDQRIAELQKELHEFRTDISGTIQQAIERLAAEKNGLITERDERIAELAQQTNQLVKAYANLQRAAFKHADREKLLEALLKRVPHHGPNGSYSVGEGQCWPDCVACEFEKSQTP